LFKVSKCVLWVAHVQLGQRYSSSEPNIVVMMERMTLDKSTVGDVQAIFPTIETLERASAN